MSQSRTVTDNSMPETALGELTAEEEPRDFAGDDEDDDDDDGPPPGFNCIARPTAADSEEKIVNEEVPGEEEQEEGNDEDDMDGPPPGWSPIAPALQPPDVEMLEKQEVLEDEDDGPPPGWKLVPSISQAADDLPTDKEVRTYQEGARGSDEGVQPGPKISPPSQLLPPIRPLPQAPSDKGQMVCGSCRQLLSYPRGAKLVQCSCCQTVNLVLEANQVGQVKCGGCAELLMYPHGAPSVKCCSCRFVTDIGAHNRRPPLSTQQAPRRSSLNLVLKE